MSFNQLEDERRFYRCLDMKHIASRRQVDQARHSFDVDVENLNMKVGDREIFGCRVKNVKDLISSRLEAQIRHGSWSINDTDSIEICVMADHGQGTTKMAIAMNTLRHPNKFCSISTLGIYGENEDRELFLHFFGQILAQLEEINDSLLTLNHKTYKVEVTMTSDLKCAKMMLGIKGGNAEHYCIFCNASYVSTCGQLDLSLGSTTPRMFGINPAVDQEHDPLIKIDVKNIRIPTLHVGMGIVNRIIKYMEDQINKFERFSMPPDFLRDDDKEVTTKIATRLTTLEEEEESAVYKVEGWNYIYHVLNTKAVTVEIVHPSFAVPVNSLEQCAVPDCIVRQFKVNSLSCGANNPVSTHAYIKELK
ncbi:unnamed protein product [Bursaphelenchus xylophilus]|uniref:(pine wood nematode) hypothetical protein n=1 Tax=Bursaphelenchus xylophilus TaxID=6326 RepID=A0A1I7S186_BURXY|nr:unnamed protein product [Bursaphelenchus xylophilus]CAG9080106.1 unnamed protein product [Bursaphelenchus xylophilus]